MSALTLEQIEWIKKYRNETGCTLREARDALMRAEPMPPTEVERLRAALSEAREVLRWVANNYRATLGRRSVRDADECLAAADRLLAPPPEATP
jgi:hypothetical protein